MERLGSCIAFLNDVVSLRFVVVVHSWPAGLGKTICPFDSGEDIGPVNGGTVLVSVQKLPLAPFFKNTSVIQNCGELLSVGNTFVLQAFK